MNSPRRPSARSRAKADCVEASWAERAVAVRVASASTPTFVMPIQGFRV